jgi:hypothetical protein
MQEEIINKLLPVFERIKTNNSFVTKHPHKIHIFVDAHSEFDVIPFNINLYDNDNNEWVKLPNHTRDVDIEEAVLYHKLTIFKMIDQSGYRCKNSEGKNCFSNLCETAYEWAWNALGFAEDVITAEEFYAKYDETYREYGQYTGYTPPFSYLDYYLEEEDKDHWSAMQIDGFDLPDRTPFDDFVDEIKREFYAEFDEIIPSIMADKMDAIAKKYKEYLW